MSNRRSPAPARAKKSAPSARSKNGGPGRKPRKPSVKKREERAAKARPLPLPLSRDQRRFLRGLGHALEPVIRVGQKGVTPPLLAETRRALAAHELIKAKLGTNAPDQTKEAAEKLAGGTGAEIVQVIGGIVLLFKAAEDPDDRRIVLPRI